MAFVRYFDTNKWTALRESELAKLLYADIKRGEVFPTLRNGELHFYYAGGCLYKLTGRRFMRDRMYDGGRYDGDTFGLTPYEKAKKQNRNRFAYSDGKPSERQFLDALNGNTFSADRSGDVVVLDIEVCLNGNICGNKKCDIVLMNTSSRRIMFVEGKIFSDPRVNTSGVPEVIAQVCGYGSAIAEQRENIARQYGNHIRTVNELFDTDYNDNIELIDDAKLVVFGTPVAPREYGMRSMRLIESELGENNVAWFADGEKSSVDMIWSALCK